MELYLQKNQLTKIEDGDFDNLEECKYINIDYNKVKYISKYLFTSMIKIETISIRFNRLQSIDIDAFNRSIFLRNLLLEGNRFNDYDQIKINQISFLNLSSNKLISLNAENFTNIEMIDLTSNSLKILKFS